jgi:hypothetical protein
MNALDASESQPACTTMPKRKDIIDSDEDEAVESDDYKEEKPKKKVLLLSTNCSNCP